MSKKHTLTLPGRYENVPQLCHFVAAGAAQAGMDTSAVFHVELACDEACTNIIEHAYGAEGVGNIVVIWQVDGDLFIITLHDTGRAFEPSTIPPPPISDAERTKPDAAQSLKIGGLGVHFMRKLMDDVRYSFDEDGNTLTLVKKISSE